jgi:methylenetetrahydrofolate dehydrogenase (NADP+) / methenyltetrahydrofolate cyclohydrolase
MSARLIDGKAVAARVRAEVAAGVAEHAERTGYPPGLATILVGDDPASALYVSGKQRASGEVGMVPFHEHLPADASSDDVMEIIERLNADPAVNGILLQLPLPGGLSGTALTGLIDPHKDVDGLTAANAGALLLGRRGLRSCTPAGVMELLADTGVELSGAEAVVVGRSNLFGKPMALMLLEANATVTMCHSRTRDLVGTCARADVLVVAAGRSHLVGAAHVKPGAVVIDVGQNRIDGKLTGDVDFEAVREIASAITPVPGGVGPMTIAMLLRNTLEAARAQIGLGALRGDGG